MAAEWVCSCPCSFQHVGPERAQLIEMGASDDGKEYEVVQDLLVASGVGAPQQLRDFGVGPLPTPLLLAALGPLVQGVPQPRIGGFLWGVTSCSQPLPPFGECGPLSIGTLRKNRLAMEPGGSQ